MSASDCFMEVGKNGYVTTQDVLTLRRQIHDDGSLDQSEINALLALAERAPDGDVEWSQFFGEAAADYYLRSEIPHDYITESTFQSIHAQVTLYSETVTPLVLSMLIKLMDQATATPPVMHKFVQEQIRNIIIARSDEPTINKTDVSNIRSFLFALGGDGNVAVTRNEAELLFNLNDLTICSKNDPAWSELFIKAIANHLMAHIGYSAPSREEALQQWKWVNDHDVNVAGFFQRMISGGMDSVRNVYAPSKQGDEQDTGDNIHAKILKQRRERALIAEKITTHESDWLATRIGRDGVYDDNERALLAYMRDLDAELPPALQELVSRTA